MLAASLAGALLAGALVSRAPGPVFLAIVLVSAVLFLPALLAAILLSGATACAALGLAMLPVLSLGWRRLPRGLWRTARGLGAGRLLTVRALIVPPLLPFLLAALLIGGAVTGLRWRLGTHAAPMFLPDPVVETG